MAKWEYKILTGAYADTLEGVPLVKYVNGKELPNWKQRNWWMTTALNELGQEEWELIEVVWRDTSNFYRDPIYILKRPIP